MSVYLVWKSGFTETINVNSSEHGGISDSQQYPYQVLTALEFAKYQYIFWKFVIFGVDCLVPVACRFRASETVEKIVIIQHFLS